MSIDQRYTTDAIKDAALVAALRASYPPREPMLSCMPFGPGEAPSAPAPLSDAEIQRIAEAVCDEQERRASHPLRVTAADVRRWIPR